MTNEVLLIDPDDATLARALERAARGDFSSVDEPAAADLIDWLAALKELRAPEGWKRWSRYETPFVAKYDKVAAVILAWWTDPLGQRHCRVGVSCPGFSSLLAPSGVRPREPLWCVHPERLVAVRVPGNRSRRETLLALCACGLIDTPANLNWMGPCCGPCHDRSLEQGHNPIRDASTFPRLMIPQPANVNGLALDAAGQLLAVSSDVVRLYDTQSGREAAVLSEAGYASQLALSTDGQWLAVLHVESNDFEAGFPLAWVPDWRSRMEVWRTRPAQLCASWETAGRAAHLAFVPGRPVLAIAREEEILFHDCTAAEPQSPCRRIETGATWLAFAPAGWPMAARSENLEVFLWRSETAEREVLPQIRWFDQLCFTADGHGLLLLHLDVQTREVVGPFENVDEYPFPVRLLDLRDGRVTRYSGGLLCSVAPLACGGRWLVAGDSSGTIAVSEIPPDDAEQGPPTVDPPLTLAWHRSSVHQLAVSADGRLLVSASDDVVRLWPLADLLAHHGIRT